MSIPIIAFINDLMTETKITSTANQLGLNVNIINTLDQISYEDQVPANQPAEPLYGRDANLVDYITNKQPGLLIFDLSNNSVPWQAWIPILKSSPATRHIPILCFGPHVDIESFKEAKNRGADVVLPRSRFMAAMPKLIQETVRIWDLEAITNACQEPPSPLAVKGYVAFNARQYFLAHEYLEDAWREDQSAARGVYKAVLQVAIAYYQITNGNYNGAVKMFLRVRQWLKPLPDHCRGIDIAKLRVDANEIHQQLLKLGPTKIDELNSAQLPSLNYDA